MRYLLVVALPLTLAPPSWACDYTAPATVYRLRGLGVSAYYPSAMAYAPAAIPLQVFVPPVQYSVQYQQAPAYVPASVYNVPLPFLVPAPVYAPTPAYEAPTVPLYAPSRVYSLRVYSYRSY